MDVKYGKAVKRVTKYLEALQNGEEFDDLAVKNLMKETIQHTLEINAWALPGSVPLGGLEQLPRPEGAVFSGANRLREFGHDIVTSQKVRVALTKGAEKAVEAMTLRPLRPERMGEIHDMLRSMDHDDMSKIPEKFEAMHGEPMDKGYIDRLTDLAIDHDHYFQSRGFAPGEMPFEYTGYGLTSGEYITRRESIVNEQEVMLSTGKHLEIRDHLLDSMYDSEDLQEFSYRHLHNASMYPHTGKDLAEKILSKKQPYLKAEMARMVLKTADRALDYNKELIQKTNEYFEDRWTEEQQKHGSYGRPLTHPRPAKTPAPNFSEYLKSKGGVREQSEYSEEHDLDQGPEL